MMELARRLAPLGVRVTLVTFEQFVTRMQHVPHPSGNLRVLGIPYALPTHFHRHSSLDPDITLTIESSILASLQDVVHTLALQGPPVTCIIGDFFLRFTHTFAAITGLPEFVFFPFSASSFASCSELHSLLLQADGQLPSNGFLTRFGRGDGSPEVQFDVPFEMPFDKSGLQKYMMELMKTRFGHMGDAHAGVIINSMEELERGVCQGRLIGPLIPLSLFANHDQKTLHTASFDEEDDQCMQWLDMQAPSSVLYIAFGSIPKYTIAQLHELALGLASSQHCFLWALRKDVAVNNPKNTVLEALPEGFLEETQHRGKIVHWAPQSRVLSHASVGGFLTNCGWNSTLEGVAAGVPILAWPELLDQFMNCSLVCTEWNVGIELERDEANHATREDVERGIRQLMEGGSPQARELRGRATSFRNGIVRAVQCNHGSYQANWKAFVDDIHKVSSEPSSSHLNLRSLL